MHTISKLTILTLCLIALGLPGCSDDDGSNDGGVDAGSDSGTPADCTFEITPEGGALEVCGLRLYAPPGAVAATTTITVTQQPMSAAPPEGLAQESPVFSLAAEPADFEFLAYVTVLFPHQVGSIAVWAAKHFPEYDAWGVFETCFKDPAWGGLRTSSLGTFTVLTDMAGNDQPSSGSADASWDGRTASFNYASPGRATYMPTASGNDSVTLYGVSAAYESFKLDFVITTGGTAEGALVSLTATDHGWINYSGITPDSTILLTMTEPEPNHLVGEVSGSLFRLEDPVWVETEFSATFDAYIARHFWGSDDPCEIP